MNLGKTIVQDKTIKSQVLEMEEERKKFDKNDLIRSIDIIFELVNEAKKGLRRNLTIEDSKTYRRDINTLALISEIFDIAQKYNNPFLLFTPRSRYVIDNGLFSYYLNKLEEYNFDGKDVDRFWKTFLKANMVAEVRKCMEKGIEFDVIKNDILYDILNHCYNNQLFSTTNEFDDFIPMILKEGIIAFIDTAIRTNNLGLLKKIFSNDPKLQEVKDKYWSGDIAKHIRKYWIGSEIFGALDRDKDDIALYLYSVLGLGNRYTESIVKNIIENNKYTFLTNLFNEMVISSNKQGIETTKREFNNFLKYLYKYLPDDEILIIKSGNDEDLVERQKVVQSLINSIENTHFTDKQIENYFSSILPSLIKFREKGEKRNEQITKLVKILGNIRNNALTVLAANNEVDKVLTLEYRKPILKNNVKN